MMTREDRLLVILLLALLICACCFTGCSSQVDSDMNSEAGTDPRSFSEARPPAKSERDNTQVHRSDTSPISYEIIKDEHLRNIKRSVDVRLPRAVNEADLRRFAQELHATDPEYDRTFIVWYLPDMESGAGAWATTHFDPALEVRVLGHSAEETRAANEYAREQEGVLGRWFDLTPYIGGAILLQQVDDALVIVHRFKDGSELRREVRERRAGDAKRLDPIEDVGEYYMIRANGDLEMHDDEGLIKSIDPL